MSTSNSTDSGDGSESFSHRGKEEPVCSVLALISKPLQTGWVVLTSECSSQMQLSAAVVPDLTRG